MQKYVEYDRSYADMTYYGESDIKKIFYPMLENIFSYQDPRDLDLESQVAPPGPSYLDLFQSLVDTNGTTTINFPVNEKCFPVNEKCFPVNEKWFPVIETIWLFIGSIRALLENFCLINFYFLGSGPLVTSSTWGLIFF